jgi:hypothetical protein
MLRLRKRNIIDAVFLGFFLVDVSHTGSIQHRKHLGPSIVPRLDKIRRSILEMLTWEWCAVRAFRTEDLCKLIYSRHRVEKKDRVAVLRALHSIKLPGTWTIAPRNSGHREMVLFDPGNADSAREKAAIDRDVAKERRATREALKLAKARLLVIQADIAEQQARRESVLAAAFEDAIEEAASAKLAAAPSETPSAPGARRVRDHS